VFDHWSRYFEIEADVVPGSLDFQEYLLLRRPEGVRAAGVVGTACADAESRNPSAT
jgi:hypothetical protein